MAPAGCATRPALILIVAGFGTRIEIGATPTLPAKWTTTAEAHIHVTIAAIAAANIKPAGSFAD
jgi:hypothetical protein